MEPVAMTDVPPLAIGVGYGKKLTIISCAVTPMVIFEAAGLAAIQCFISFEGPNLKQDIKDVTGGSWLHNIKEYMIEADAVEADINAYGVRALFEVAEVVDALVWWVFLASVLAEFLIEWSTQINRIGHCVPTPGEYWVDGRDAESVLVPDFVWRPACAFYNCETNQGTHVDVGSTHTINKGQEITLVCAQLWGDVANHPQQVQQRVIRDATGEQLDYSPTFDGLANSYWGCINNIDKLNGEDGDTTFTIQGVNSDATPLIEFFAYSGHFYYRQLTFPEE